MFWREWKTTACCFGCLNEVAFSFFREETSCGLNWIMTHLLDAKVEVISDAAGEPQKLWGRKVGVDKDTWLVLLILIRAQWQTTPFAISATAWINHPLLDVHVSVLYDECFLWLKQTWDSSHLVQFSPTSGFSLDKSSPKSSQDTCSLTCRMRWDKTGTRMMIWSDSCITR